MKVKKEKVGIVDRVLIALFSVIATYCTAFGVLFFSRGAVSGDPSGQGLGYILGQGWLYWIINGLAIIAGIAGFVLGSSRMAEVWGFIWRTNKPKDGNWL